MSRFKLVVVIMLILVSACSTPATRRGGQLAFETAIQVNADEQFHVSLGVENTAEEAFRGDDQFDASMEIRDAEGELVAEETVTNLRALESGETAWPAAFAEQLPPGAYELTWGAPGYGSTIVSFEILEQDGRLYLAGRPLPEPTDTAVPTEEPQGEQERLVELARQDLAKQLNISLDEVTVSEVTATEFPDTSLGVPKPGQMYSQVITPGYTIRLTANSREYVYHGAGDRVVLVPEKNQVPVDKEESGTLVMAAIQDLAKRLNISIDQIRVKEVLPATFRDTSLGVSKPGEVYAQVITKGYIIRLQAQGVVYEYHGAGERVVFVPDKEEMPSRRGDEQELVDEAVADLAEHLGTSPEKITVETVEPMTFRDSSLGVPEPGKNYIQVLTPGYVLRLKALGKTYEYHASGSRVVRVPPEQSSAVPSLSPIVTQNVNVEAGQRLIFSGISSLPEGTELTAQLYKDDQPVSWWPENVSTQVQKGRWEIMVPLGRDGAPPELDPTSQYLLRVHAPQQEDVDFSTFAFDVAPPLASMPRQPGPAGSLDQQTELAIVTLLPDSVEFLQKLPADLDDDDQAEIVVLGGYGQGDAGAYDNLEFFVLDQVEGEYALAWHSGLLETQRAEPLQLRDLNGDGALEVVSRQSTNTASYRLYVVGIKDDGFGLLKPHGGHFDGQNGFGEYGVRLVDEDQDGVFEILASYSPGASKTDVYKWHDGKYVYTGTRQHRQ